jgi:hypothetical protein
MLAPSVPHRDPTPPHLARLLGALHGVRPAGTQRWMACCPAHPDRTPSLAIRLGRDNTILVYDFGAHCRVQDIVRAVGLTVADLFDPAPVTGSRRWR